MMKVSSGGGGDGGSSSVNIKCHSSIVFYVAQLKINNSTAPPRSCIFPTTPPPPSQPPQPLMLNLVAPPILTLATLADGDRITEQLG